VVFWGGNSASEVLVWAGVVVLLCLGVYLVIGYGIRLCVVWLLIWWCGVSFGLLWGVLFVL